VFLELFLNSVNVRRGQIDFVDCNHDLHMRRSLGVIDRLNGLRHDAVIGRDNEHDDIRYVGAARAHLSKGCVTGCVDERKSRAIMFDGVRADVLGYSARFTSRHPRLTNRIQERCFPMIDVTHECNDGTARLKFLFRFNDRRRRRDDYLFHLVNPGSLFTTLLFQNKPVIFCNLRCDVGLDCLIDVGEDVVSHQLGDELMRFQAKLSC
jgi:hypothetical protein